MLLNQSDERPVIQLKTHVGPEVCATRSEEDVSRWIQLFGIL